MQKHATSRLCAKAVGNCVQLSSVPRSRRLALFPPRIQRRLSCWSRAQVGSLGDLLAHGQISSVHAYQVRLYSAKARGK